MFGSHIGGCLYICTSSWVPVAVRLLFFTKNFFIAGLFLAWGVFCILGFLNVLGPNVIFAGLFV